MTNQKNVIHGENLIFLKNKLPKIHLHVKVFFGEKDV
jgi:hypothetical protein